MSNFIEAIAVASDDLPAKPNQNLGHLPGPKGHWLTGNIKQLLPNPQPYLAKLQAEHGDCFTVGFFLNKRLVVMAGAEANQMLLLDKEHNFSSRLGWDVVAPFFGRNILVRDFEDHRAHRKLMTQVFKGEALKHYLKQMNPIITSALDEYEGEVDVYQQTKQLALDIAIRVFAGVTDQAQLGKWNTDLTLVLTNVMAHHIRLPGTKFWQALSARNRLRQRLATELESRRHSEAADLFSSLARQRDDNGAQLSPQDVIDHMFGLLFAAHDTTASSLAMMFWLLAEHPEWQNKARIECESLYSKTRSTHLAAENLDQLPTLEAIFKETLRLYAPIQFVPRRNVKAFKFQALDIPANSQILLAPQATHFNPAIFSAPEQFNPGRFLDTPAADTAPPFAFVPFGKGSHMCLGMHFAHMEIKAVLYQLLLTYRVGKADNQPLALEYLPIVKSQTEMRLQFTKR